VTEQQLPDVLQPKPRFRGFGGTSGYLLPLVIGGSAFGLGWWVGGYWLGLGLAIGGCVLALLVIFRFARTSIATEMGCASVLIVILVVTLVPAVERIKEAAKRIQAEQDAKKQKSPEVPSDKTE
jgi:hypothetical protein